MGTQMHSVTFAIIAIVLHALKHPPAHTFPSDTSSNSAKLSCLLPGLPKTWYNSNYCTGPRWHPQPKCVLSNMLGIKSFHPHQTLCHNGSSNSFSQCHSCCFHFACSKCSPLLPANEDPFCCPANRGHEGYCSHNLKNKRDFCHWNVSPNILSAMQLRRKTKLESIRPWVIHNGLVKF